MAESQEFAVRTSIGWSDQDHIYVRGKDLVDEVMGRMSFSQTIFLLIAGREPEPAEVRLLDACLVSLADHGLTLSAMIARANATTAPEAIQGAVAAGLLGIGSVITGSMEGCGRVLDELARETAAGREPREAVAALVAARRAEGGRLPGLGHRVHRGGDPRADRLLALARETGLAGRHVELLELLAAEWERQSGRRLPINVTGAIAAVLMEMGLEWWILRGFALISRCAGLVAHIREERGAPVVPEVRRLLDGAQHG